MFGQSNLGIGVHGESYSDEGVGVVGFSDPNIGVFGRSNSGTGVNGYSTRSVGVRGSSGGSSGIGVGVLGTSPESYGVQGYSAYNIGVLGQSDRNVGVAGESPRLVGVRGMSDTGNGVLGWSYSGLAVAGQSIDGIAVAASSTNGDAVLASSTNKVGVRGLSGMGDGVFGSSDGGTAVHGESNSGYGVHAKSTTGLAAYLEGDVTITGTLTKTSGSFKIDHPLDPANKYLSHSFVESPDMKNVYDGVVLLDDKGEAEVKLPSWFDALNKDFRYQLTAIGAPGPNLYIAKEIFDSGTSLSRNGSNKNRFKIAGGTPYMKVSWQVTGTRSDPWANAHRIQVEEDKSEHERGYYMYPDLYGQSAENGISRVLFPEELPPINKNKQPKRKRSY